MSVRVCTKVFLQLGTLWRAAVRHVPFSRASSFLLIGESSFKSRKQTEFRETEESVDQPSEVMECFVFRLKNQYLDLNHIVFCYPLKVSSIEDW